MAFHDAPIMPLLDTTPHDRSSAPVRWPDCCALTHPLKHNDLYADAGAQSGCTMTDLEALPVVAEAAAGIRRPALQIYEDMISQGCTPAFCKGPPGTRATAQPCLHLSTRFPHHKPDNKWKRAVIEFIVPQGTMNSCLGAQ